MSLFHALLLGILQGVTEFLPVSSSGHLAIVPWLFGWDDFAGDQALENAFDVALHLGTLIGAVVYLRTDIRQLVKACSASLLGRSHDVAAARRGCLVALTALPTGLIGLTVFLAMEDLGDRIWVVCTCLSAFGVLLFFADRRDGDRTFDSLSVREALLLGVVQGLAFQPGVSRSGVVLTMARGIGLERVAAARLAFLMSLPVIAGAGLVSMMDISLPNGWWPAFLVGMAASAVSGWFAVHWMLQFLSRRGLRGLAVYRILVGLSLLLLLAYR